MYVIAILCSMLFFNRLALSPNLIVGLIVGILLVYYFNGKTKATHNSFIAGMKEILSSPILKPHLYKDLYRDSELVIFLDTYKEYHGYNPDAYNTLVRNINDYLIVGTNIEISSYYHKDYEILRDIKVNILNTFHSFIYRITHSAATMKKYQDGMTTLEKLLNYHIDKAHRTSTLRDQDAGVSTRSHFPHRNHPKHYDVSWNDRFEYF